MKEETLPNYGETISMGELRKHLGEIVDRVQYQRRRFVLDRKGKPVAVVLPVEDYERAREYARSDVDAILDRAQAGGSGEDLTDDELLEIVDKEIHAMRAERKPGKGRRK